MTLHKTAIVDVNDEDEVASFYSWLLRNQSRVTAISENEGCGCCVDIFSLEVESDAEMMPCESGGDFNIPALKFGFDKDWIILSLLAHQGGSKGGKAHQ